MQKEEILAGLKNAIARGQTLEQAKNSFINAGYNSQDVEDSAQVLEGTISSMPQQPKPISPQQPQTISSLPEKKPKTQPQSQQQKPQKPKKSKTKKLIIILIIIFVILLAGLIITIMFKDRIIDFLRSIL